MNAAIAKTTGFKSDLLCKPFYFGTGLAHHMSNNWTRMVKIKNGKLTSSDDCFALAPTPINNLSEIREFESAHGIS